MLTIGSEIFTKLALSYEIQYKEVSLTNCVAANF
jgi:hypothetical protein